MAARKPVEKTAECDHTFVDNNGLILCTKCGARG